MLNEYLGKLIPISMNLGKLSFYPVEGSCAHSTVLSNPYIRAQQISLRKLKKFYTSSSLITVVPATPTPPMPVPLYAESRSVSLWESLMHTAQLLLFYWKVQSKSQSVVSLEMQNSLTWKHLKKNPYKWSLFLKQE